MLERYQRYLFHYRKKNGEPLSFRSQHDAPGAAAGVVQVDGAAALTSCTTRPASWSCRASGTGCPKHVLTAAEAEQVLAAAQHRTIRWACATAPSWRRCTRPACAAWSWRNLKLYDLDLERGTVTIRQGKGKKDRIIPIGDRAAAWIAQVPRRSAPAAGCRARRRHACSCPMPASRSRSTT